MEVGIGLPNATLGTRGWELVTWAREAEQAGFSCLGTIDRLVYGNYEPLVALAAAAAVTDRIRLVTSVLLAPLRTNTALLAKQAASVDSLSGGRLVLGLAPGARQDDFELSRVDHSTRGKLFDYQLQQLWGFWNGREVGPVAPGGPTVVIGGSVKASFRRAARFGSGWIMGGGPQDFFRQALPKVRDAWREAGRDGEPRTMALGYYSLGPRAEENASKKLGHYYAYLGEHAQGVADSAAKDAGAVKAHLAAFDQAGCDEFIFFPSDSNPEQVGLLREAIDG